MRNRIAHGQWINIIDYESKDENETEEKKEKKRKKIEVAEEELLDLNHVDIMNEFKIHILLGKIIRDLVQSPNRAFSKNYEQYIEELNNFLEKSKNWTIDSKIEKLKKKSKKLMCPECKHEFKVKK